MNSRKYIVVIVVVALAFWGPIDHSWPAWLPIRTGYLIGMPVAAWFLLGWIWKAWQPDAAAEDRLQRALAAATAGVLAILAILAARVESHTNVDEFGDNHVVLAGPDWLKVIMLIAAAGFALWFSITKKESR